MSNFIRRIYIDSSDRVNPWETNSNDITVSLGESLKDVESVMLINASIPISFHNVTSQNNTFHWLLRNYGVPDNPLFPDWFDSSSSFTIPVGNYNTTTLMAAVKLAWDTQIATMGGGASGTVDITFNESTNKFSVAFQGLYFNGSDLGAGVYAWGNIADKTWFDRILPNQDINKTLNGMLGFVYDMESQRPNTSGGTLEVAFQDSPSGTNVYTSNRLHSVYGLEYLYITSPLAQGASTSSANSSLNRILVKVPIQSYFAEINYSSSGSHSEPVMTTQSTFNEISFRVVDKAGTLVNLFNGNWSATLIVNYREEQPNYFS